MAGHDYIEYPHAQEDDGRVYEFTADELAEVEKHKGKYPDPRSAVMPVLWMAQEKYGWLPQKAIKLVADTLGMSFAHVYGVATFYTMYLKESPGKHLLEICTCFTCGECGGDKLYSSVKKKYNLDEHGASSDGFFWVREAECLGACDTAPVLQLDNNHLLHNVDMEKFDRILSDLRSGVEIVYEQVPLIAR